MQTKSLLVSLLLVSSSLQAQEAPVFGTVANVTDVSGMIYWCKPKNSKLECDFNQFWLDKSETRVGTH